MTKVADHFKHIVGIDTHARTHTYCVIEARTGVVIDTAAFPTTPAGNNRAINWITRRSQGTTTLAAVEGTSSYGTSITAALTATGIQVAEVRPQPRARELGSLTRSMRKPQHEPCSEASSNGSLNLVKPGTAPPFAYS